MPSLLLPCQSQWSLKFSVLDGNKTHIGNTQHRILVMKICCFFFFSVFYCSLCMCVWMIPVWSDLIMSTHWVKYTSSQAFRCHTSLHNGSPYRLNRLHALCWHNNLVSSNSIWLMLWLYVCMHTVDRFPKWLDHLQSVQLWQLLTKVMALLVFIHQMIGQNYCCWPVCLCNQHERTQTYTHTQRETDTQLRLANT